MAINLTAINSKLIYVVYDKKNFTTILETEKKEEAIFFTKKNKNYEYSIYPPYTYAKHK